MYSWINEPLLSTELVKGARCPGLDTIKVSDYDVELIKA